jgi:hypothetical protein
LWYFVSPHSNSRRLWCSAVKRARTNGAVVPSSAEATVTRTTSNFSKTPGLGSFGLFRAHW